MKGVFSCLLGAVLLSLCWGNSIADLMTDGEGGESALSRFPTISPTGTWELTHTVTRSPSPTL